MVFHKGRNLRLSLIALTTLIAATNVTQAKQVKQLTLTNVRVVDGDTLADRRSKDRIRLEGIDACEVGQAIKIQSGQRLNCADPATQRLKQLTENQKLKCTYSGKDVYDRWLADCTNQRGENLSRTLLAEGLVRIYTYLGKPTRPDMVAYERAAQQSRLGFWKYPSFPPQRPKKTRGW